MSFKTASTSSADSFSSETLPSFSPSLSTEQKFFTHSGKRFKLTDVCSVIQQMDKVISHIDKSAFSADLTRLQSTKHPQVAKRSEHNLNALLHLSKYKISHSETLQHDKRTLYEFYLDSLDHPRFQLARFLHQKPSPSLSIFPSSPSEHRHFVTQRKLAPLMLSLAHKPVEPVKKCRSDHVAIPFPGSLKPLPLPMSIPVIKPQLQTNDPPSRKNTTKLPPIKSHRKKCF